MDLRRRRGYVRSVGPKRNPQQGVSEALIRSAVDKAILFRRGTNVYEPRQIRLDPGASPFFIFSVRIWKTFSLILDMLGKFLLS